MYPPDWPRCVICGEPAMDGHLTCGNVECGEREVRDSEYALSRHVKACRVYGCWCRTDANRRQDETLSSVFSAALDASEDRDRLAETLRELVRRARMRTAIVAAGLDE